MALRPLLLAAVLASPSAGAFAAGPGGKATAPYSFSAIGHLGGDEAALRQALADAGEAAFVAATGIKAPQEPCSDKLYGQRRDMLDEAARPVMLILAASDWSECRNSLGKSAAIERLGRLREVFFSDANSLGARKLPVTRQSSVAKFRSYAENAYWEIGNVLYATVNIPANNNHYLKAAGRNSEYEDRLVANRSWLHRLFMLAQRRKVDGIVLFSEGDLSTPVAGNAPKEDGFAEPRKQIDTLAKKFDGKVLLVDAAKAAEAAITWRGNIGHLSLGTSSTQVKVTPGAAALFTLKGAPDA